MKAVVMISLTEGVWSDPETEGSERQSSSPRSRNFNTRLVNFG
ncbi:hypothetical protein [Peribacillus simplex]|nr:hypothetical protein [Peribacillus simplex]